MVSCRLGKLIVQWVVSDCHTCGRTITVPREFSRLHWACTESIVASSYTLATVFCDVTTNNNNTKRNHTHKQRIQLNTHHQPCSPYSVNNHCNSQWYFGSLEVPTKLSVRLISQIAVRVTVVPIGISGIPLRANICEQLRTPTERCATYRSKPKYKKLI